MKILATFLIVLTFIGTWLYFDWRLDKNWENLYGLYILNSDKINETHELH